MIKYNNTIVIQFDTTATGNAGSGKPVTVYLTGTNTKAFLFDENNQPVSNPTFSDSEGNYGFFIDAGTYDLVIDEALPTETRIDNEPIGVADNFIPGGGTSIVEQVTLSPGQTVVNLTTVNAFNCAFYIDGANEPAGRLGTNRFTINTSAQITLSDSGTQLARVIAVENDTTATPATTASQVFNDSTFPGSTLADAFNNLNVDLFSGDAALDTIGQGFGLSATEVVILLPITLNNPPSSLTLNGSFNLFNTGTGLDQFTGETPTLSAESSAKMCLVSFSGLVGVTVGATYLCRLNTNTSSIQVNA